MGFKRQTASFECKTPVVSNIEKKIGVLIRYSHVYQDSVVFVSRRNIANRDKCGKLHGWISASLCEDTKHAESTAYCCGYSKNGDCVPCFTVSLLFVRSMLHQSNTVSWKLAFWVNHGGQHTQECHPISHLSLMLMMSCQRQSSLFCPWVIKTSRKRYLSLEATRWWTLVLVERVGSSVVLLKRIRRVTISL